MSDQNFGEVYNPTEHFSQFQRQALADWASAMSDYRLETVRKQLEVAIASYDVSRDNALLGLAMCARSDAVNHEIARRGGVAMQSPLCVPWGKSISDGETWSLTDYTKLPPPEDRGIFVQTEERPLNLLLQGFGSQERPIASTYAPYYNYGSGFGDFNHNINTMVANTMVPDFLNDGDEAESYRKADNDFSGMPVISCEVIDIDNPSQFMMNGFLAGGEDPMNASANFAAVEPFTQPQETLSGPEVDDDAQTQNNDSAEPTTTTNSPQPGAEALDFDDTQEAIDPKSLRTEWVSDSPY